MDSRAEAEFSEFMLGRWPRLVRLGYGLTGDQGLAEDLAQTALAKAFASWPRVRRAGDPDAYVRRIMLNANSARFRKRRVREQLTGVPPEPGPGRPGDPAARHDDRSALIAALMRLPHGQRSVVVHPTEAYGQRYAAFAIPLPLAISRVVAYAGQAELRQAVPFNSASGAIIATWLRPGQPGLPRSTHRIGSGRAGGQAWSETVHVGPWGYCFTGIIGGCFDTVSRSLGNRVGTLTGLGPAKTNWVVGTGTAAVDHVRVTLSGGSSLKVAAADAGGPRFFAFAIPQGARLVRVDYYTASGRLVAREPASQIG